MPLDDFGFRKIFKNGVVSALLRCGIEKYLKQFSDFQNPGNTYVTEKPKKSKVELIKHFYKVHALVIVINMVEQNLSCIFSDLLSYLVKN